MINDLKEISKGISTIYNETAENLMLSFHNESFNLIFTSPPYYNLERYGDSNIESTLKSHKT